MEARRVVILNADRREAARAKVSMGRVGQVSSLMDIHILTAVQI